MEDNPEEKEPDRAPSQEKAGHYILVVMGIKVWFASTIMMGWKVGFSGVLIFIVISLLVVLLAVWLPKSTSKKSTPS